MVHHADHSCLAFQRTTRDLASAQVDQEDTLALVTAYHRASCVLKGSLAVAYEQSHSASVGVACLEAAACVAAALAAFAVLAASAVSSLGMQQTASVELWSHCQAKTICSGHSKAETALVLERRRESLAGKVVFASLESAL